MDQGRSTPHLLPTCHLGNKLSRLSCKAHYPISTSRPVHPLKIKINIESHINMLLTLYKLECGPMPNVMAALPNIGGTLCSTPQSLADAHYQIGV